jgi:hypothetical protein
MRSSRFVIVTAAALASAAGVHAQCQPTWDRAIGTPGASSGYVQPMKVWNDGTGEKLYVGGSFTDLGGSGYISSYDLSSGTWMPIPGITAGGSFVTSFARFNPGSGEKLIVGGANWDMLAGIPLTRGIAMWDGQNWHATGANFDNFTQTVWALHVWDDGSGPKLYIGGGFETIGGISANRIARWDGTTFEALGGGITTASSSVFKITNYNDGSGDALYAGGNFNNVEGNLIRRLARWNGSTWSQVGGGISFSSAAQGIAEMMVLDIGDGPELFITGTQFSAEGNLPSNAARWNGQQWRPVGQGMAGSVRQLVVLDEGNGPVLYAGGAGATGFGNFGYYMRLNQEFNVWESTGVAFDNTVFGVYAHNNTLYLGGSFTTFFDGTSGPDPVGRIITRSICPAIQPCYANCDGSTVEPVLNVDDFTCFINSFAQAQTLPHGEQITAYANCDGSSTAPVLNVDDFTCFINRFAIGCP